MSTLTDKLLAQIAQSGPLTVADYMQACLYDPEFGYYATRPALGDESGDFITAPEASQMFGELLGLWCAHEWTVLGAPDPVQWIELGPGRGVLMQDAQRATARHPFSQAARVTLVETSAPLRVAQAENVMGAAWADRLDQAPPGPTLLIANEFLDCLPIRQFVLLEDGWHEKLIGAAKHGGLTFGLSAPLPAPESEDEIGTVREIAAGLAAVVYEVEKRLKAAPGRALFIDYGYAAAEGADTLQALKGHKKVDPLETPGAADLTAHVDFGVLKRMAEASGLDVYGPIGQGVFLQALGLDERAEALSEANPDRAARIAREHARLTEPEQMGALFKVICLSSPNLPPPAGF